jgi:hypothetical protein
MCVVSMIGDHFHDKWNQPPYNQYWQDLSKITRQEFDALKKEVEEMKELLKKAKLYDEKNNEPNCEIEEKIKTLKKIAELMGVDLNDVLKNK